MLQVLIPAISKLCNKFIISAKSSQVSSSQSDDNSVIKRAEPPSKRKPDNTTKETHRSKKRQRKRIESTSDKKEKTTSSELSESDKQLLDRWKSMQTKTKPFIHPIRKYMKEINDLKEQELGTQELKTVLDKADEENTTSKAGVQLYQFTNYTLEKGNGESLKAVKQPLVGDQPAPLFSQTVLGKVVLPSKTLLSCFHFAISICFLCFGWG